MTLSYYEAGIPYINKIQRWYYSKYSVKISRKHAILFAIGNVGELSESLVQHHKRFFGMFGKSKIISIPIEKRFVKHKIRSLEQYTHTRSIPFNTTIVAIAFATSLAHCHTSIGIRVTDRLNNLSATRKLINEIKERKMLLATSDTLT